MKPNFLYIGTGRAGSTWLFQSLAAHPEVYLTPVKETNFFDLNYHRGLAWYESFFNAADARVIGEIAHRYLRDAQVAERIRHCLGPVKCIAVLRRPEEYVFSCYQFACRNGRFRGDAHDWMRARFEPESVRYFSLLKPFLDAMGEENIHIGCFDDLERDPQAFYDEICRFLCLRRKLLGDQDRRQVNAAGVARLPALAAATNRISKIVKRLGGQRLIATVKRQPGISRLLYARPNPHATVGLGAADREIIRGIAVPELRLLDAHRGSAFQLRWYPEVAGIDA